MQITEEKLMEIVKHKEGKLPMGRLLEYPDALQAVGKILGLGEKQYGRNTWREAPRMDIVDAAMRHTVKSGANMDKLDLNEEGEVDERHLGLPHTASIVVNLLMLLQSQIEEERRANAHSPI